MEDFSENRENEGAREINVEGVEDLFQLETLSMYEGANGPSCVVILCWVKRPT